MNKEIIIAPSILSADFSNLAADIKKVEKAGAKWLHIDVMDGCFVPNITIGPAVVNSIRKVSKLFFDVHLMIERPDIYWESFKKAGADLITIHAEIKIDKIKLLKEIKKAGLKTGISIKPGTSVSQIANLLPYTDLVLVMSVEPGFGGQKFMPEVLVKFKDLKKIIEMKGLNIILQIDGGINKETAVQAVKAGASILVAGNSVFGAATPQKALKSLEKSILLCAK